MSLKNKLSIAVTEKDVENTYKNEILRRVGGQITSPFNIDGLLEADNVRSLLEFKHDLNLKSRLDQTNVLIQCLYYIKRFEQAGEKLPTTIFVGDINECFALQTNAVVKYLDKEIDWSIAASTAHRSNPELIKVMVGDDDITPFVFDVDDNFTIEQAIDKIKDLSENVVRKIKVTKDNMDFIFRYFDENVLTDNKITTNQKANLFVQILINPKDNFLHPNQKNVLTSDALGNVRVNSNQFTSFFSHFDGDSYSPKEKEELTALVDRLVEDTTRRRNGEFFTPTPFVDLAHKYIESVYGSDWKERFIVWDCAWGTGNLTRDYKFKNLFVSTLEQTDLDTANQMGYNPEATKFQFDFLNDSDDKLPKELKDAIVQGKEILFLINPPYATANNKNTTEGSHKQGVSLNKVGDEMRETKEWGGATQNLYAQFFYRIWKYRQMNDNVHVASFTPPLYLTGGSYKRFRNKFFSSFGIEKGFLFQASHFSDVSAEWGILFAVMNNQPKLVDDVIVNLVDLNKSFSIDVLETKDLYHTDNLKKASDWVREEVKGLKTFDAPQLSNWSNVKSSGRGKVVKNYFGYFQNNANSTYYNPNFVALYSGNFSGANGLSITKENFKKVCNLFTARKAIQSNWINQKDEYLAPNEQHPQYEQFTYDALVYSLFNNSSQQSSLRQVDYKNKKWDIKNEFFWLSKDEILELANGIGYDELYKDARTASNRHMYKLLFENGIYEKLSPIAKDVLDRATELLKKSFEFRMMLSEEHREYHLDSWDAGYAQLKLVWGKYYKDEFNEFRNAYSELEKQMIPLVYELGFLKK